MSLMLNQLLDHPPSSFSPRYQLYGHWKNDTYEKHPELIEARTQILSRGRYIMK